MVKWVSKRLTNHSKKNCQVLILRYPKLDTLIFVKKRNLLRKQPIMDNIQIIFFWYVDVLVC